MSGAAERDLYGMQQMSSAAMEQLRERVIDDVLEIQRKQEDQEADLQLDGSFEINPNTFGQGKNHLIVGPINFEQSFQTIPSIYFGQKPYIISSDTRYSETGVATGYIPFVLQPYVYAFTWESGLVDGLYVGLYALTEPPVRAQSHTVDWFARGTGSRYSDERTTEAWIEPDDMSDVGFLSEDEEYSSEDDEGYYEE